MNPNRTSIMPDSKKIISIFFTSFVLLSFSEELSKKKKIRLLYCAACKIACACFLNLSWQSAAAVMSQTKGIKLQGCSWSTVQTLCFMDVQRKFMSG